MIDYQYEYRLHGIHSSENNLIYIPILKNAHSWGEKFFSHNFNCNETVHITQYNKELYKDKRFVVILRDPIDRWVSAMAQYLVEFDNPDELLDNVLIKKLITDGINFDRHSKPQRYDLIGLDIKKTVVFMCNDELENNLSLFSSLAFKKPTESIGEHNRNSQNILKKTLYPKIKSMVEQNISLQDRLKEFYYIDYTLITQLQSRIIKDYKAKYIIKDIFYD
jgi:hypothetical protein